MMRKMFSVALMATLACALGLAQSANAGVTIDVVFQDATVPSGITILPGDTAAPGCTFTGWYKTVVTGVRCMDVIMTVTGDDWIGMGTSVTYDFDNGLALASMYEWKGFGVSFSKLGAAINNCGVPGGIVDKGGIIQSFDCIIAPPNAPPQAGPGTWRIGTILWDTSATTAGTDVIAAFIDPLFDGFIAVIDGNIVDTSSFMVVGNQILTIIPEPGTVSLLGLGMVGLILAGRRSR
jgi:hypothetical protein